MSYLSQSLVQGLAILGFDKETIKKVAREKSLEEIFLSTLFLNYLFVLIVYAITVFMGGISIEGRELNMPVFFGLLMVYPFLFNVLVYVVYGFFGLMAEIINSKNHVKPLISVGFHTAIVYTIVFYIIGFLGLLSLSYGAILLGLFGVYFLYTMFLSISTIYNYSFAQSLIVILIPLLVISLVGLVVAFIFPQVIRDVLTLFLL